MAEHTRYKRIVVPLDGSGWAQRAVPHAVDIARSNDSELILLHVFRPSAPEYTPELALSRNEDPNQQMREQIKQYLIGLRTELRKEHLQVITHVVEGLGVANLICDYVNQESVDLVVMSTHGRTGIRKFLFGSIANEIMECAEVPVLLVRPDKESV